MNLGCVESAVPGDTLGDKLGILELHGMWLELVNKDLGKKRLRHILDILPSFNTPIRSIQAYRLHDLRMLSAANRDREVAMRHVEETMEIPSRVGAQNVVVVATYGEPTIDRPRERCVEIFKHFGKLGAESNLVISIEALDITRTTFLPSVSQVCELVRDVGSDNVRLMVDTAHIYTNRKNVTKIIQKHVAEITEIHLRDTNSRPPGLGDIDFTPVLRVIRERFKGLISLEYRPGPNPGADFTHARKLVANLISAAR